MSDELRVTADIVITQAGEPLPGGTVIIRHGRIVDVSSQTDSQALSLSPGVLMPGLVNCHTHLEFSDFTQPIPGETPMTGWLKQVIAARRQRRSDPRAAIQAGLVESIRSGTVVVGEIATGDGERSAYVRGSWLSPQASGPPMPRAIIFDEILGLTPERIAVQRERIASTVSRAADLERWSMPQLSSPLIHSSAEPIAGRPATERAEAHSAEPPPVNSDQSSTRPVGEIVQGLGTSVGLSPHAPYTVDPQLFYDTLNAARGARLPVAMHLAESAAERLLVERAEGPFAEFLEELGLWNPGQFGSLTYCDYLRELATAPIGLVVHGNDLRAHELKYLARCPQLTLVYCPRTHAAFGHPPHPWQQLQAAGGRVAIGTDSRASNPDLSLFAELQFLQSRYPEESAESLLALATSHAAQALGLPHGYGQIVAGGPAHLLWVRPGSSDWQRTLLAADAEIAGVMQEGQWVASGPR